MSAVDLHSLRERPYQLLLEIERRARAAQAGQIPVEGSGAAWVGVAFRVATETFLVARDELREVMSVPAALTRVPGAHYWIRGLINLRGQVLPIIDLRAFLGGAVTQIGRNARILVPNNRDVPAGLLVDEVMGFRRFIDQEFSAQPLATILNCDRYLAGAFRRGGEVAPVFSLSALLESNEFLMGAAQ